MRLLFLGVHGRDRSPSQRYRFEAFDPALRRAGSSRFSVRSGEEREQDDELAAFSEELEEVRVVVFMLILV